MVNSTFRSIPAFILPVLLMVAIHAHASRISNRILLCCRNDNDLYVTLKENRIPCNRYDTAEEVAQIAPEGAAVMILADGYPEQTTRVDAAFYKTAGKKN